MPKNIRICTVSRPSEEELFFTTASLPGCPSSVSWELIPSYSPPPPRSFSVPLQVGVIQMMTVMLEQSQEEKEEEKRLSEMQQKMSSSLEFDATYLIAALGRREDEVGSEAISFGIKLLHGGNPKAQDNLLRYLRERKVGLFPTISNGIQVWSLLCTVVCSMSCVCVCVCV